MSEDVRLVGETGEELEPAALVAHVTELERDAALAYRDVAYGSGRLLERDRLAIWGLGEAASIELAASLTKDAPGQAAALLGAIATVVDDEPSNELPHAALAFGALSFDPAGAGRLVLPRWSICIGADRASVIALSRRETATRALPAPAEFAPAVAVGPAPDQFALVSARPHEHYRALVAAATAAIAAGEFDKVVLAREVTVEANRPFVVSELLERLRVLYPTCATFAVDGFIGASPELLCQKHGRHVRCFPLAGTVARSGDPADDARHAAGLLASAKDRAEHRYVVEAIAACLARYADVAEIPAVPEILELRNVLHLGTPINAEMTPTHTESLLELVAELHPTPAVGGSPRDPALAHLARHEGLVRDRYAGPVGYLTGDGDGEFWIGIRSAMIEGNRARLIAGAGIVAGSVPDQELAETQLKLQALLAAAVRP